VLKKLLIVGSSIQSFNRASTELQQSFRGHFKELASRGIDPEDLPFPIASDDTIG
jgi:hypothetical protein